MNFGAQEVTLILVACLLLFASKPLLQGWSKVTETLIFLFGRNQDPKNRNLVKSSELSTGYQDIIGDTLFREPTLPGLLIFSLFFVDIPAKSIHVDLTANDTITLAATAFFFTLFRVIAATKKSATRSAIPISHMLSGGFLFAFLTFSYRNNLSWETTVSTLILSCFVAQISTTAARGMRNYGVLSIFWIPAALFCWATRVFSYAILGPIALILSSIEVFSESKKHPKLKPSYSDSTPD
jgi:hypothetical protein